MQIDVGIIALDNVSWTPLQTGIDCHRVDFHNVLSVIMKYRRNSSDPNTELTIQPLQSKTFESTKNSIIHKNDILGYAQLASGTGNIKRECAY